MTRPPPPPIFGLPATAAPAPDLGPIGNVLSWQRAFSIYEDVIVVGFYARSRGPVLHLRREVAQVTEITARMEAHRFVTVVVIDGIPLRRYESGALTPAHAVETFVRLLRQPYTMMKLAARRQIAGRIRAGKDCDHIPIVNAAVEYLSMRSEIETERIRWPSECVGEAANLIAPVYNAPTRTSP